MPSAHVSAPKKSLACWVAGWMGEVCRARDTKLQRDVAIKGLPLSPTMLIAWLASSARLARSRR